ncbi:MAG: hypothetical protein HYX69_19285 [Planctomycetia bacterium]|nr:hypothetical protein [Planctomycetia bacterium]
MSDLFLMRDVDGRSLLDAERVRDCLRHLPGVWNWNENDRWCLFVCEYQFQGDRATVQWLEGCGAAIEGRGDAALQIAVEIQRCYGEEIHAVDPEGSFDIPLSEVSSLTDFQDKIARQWGRENLERG